MGELRIIDRTAECDDGKHRMRVDKPSGITIHMFGVPGITNAADIAGWYRANPQYTGGQMPYTLVVSTDGTIELALQIQEVGPHALRWSSPTMGVVAIGDFNMKPPQPIQFDAAADIVAEFCTAFGIDPLRADSGNIPFLAGHTERPDSTKWRDKVCPGSLWPMPLFRRQVAEMQREGAFRRLSLATVP